MALSGLLTLPNHLIGVCKLVKLDSASMRKLVQMCKEMTEVPADLFTHPYFRNGANLSGWKMKSLPSSELWFGHVLRSHCCGEGSEIVGLLLP